MGLAQFKVTRADFDATDWQAVPAASEKKECWSYIHAFFKRANEERDAGNLRAEAVHVLLGVLCSFQFTPDNPRDPFACRERAPGGAPPTIDDLTVEQVAVLQDILPTIADDDLRARIADLVWLRARDYKAGEAAIAAYRASATTLEDPEDWCACADRLVRAVRLAASLGVNRDTFTECIKHVEGVLAKYDGEDPRFFSSTLMGLLLDHGAGEPATYAQLAGKGAARAEEKGDYSRARTYRDLQVRWCLRGGDREGARTAGLAVAATFEAEADRFLSGPTPNHLLASMSLEHAVVALRRAGAGRERIVEAHQRLLQEQGKAAEQMMGHGFSQTTDVSDLAALCVKEVAGKPLGDALLAFVVRCGGPPQVGVLRDRVLESLRNFPLQNLFAQSFMSESGKTTAKRRAPGYSDPTRDEDVVQSKMFEEAKWHHSLHAVGMIEPARERMFLEHPLRLNDFLAIATYSSFVPMGREYIYARGLLDGMAGDYLSAAHLLIPQVEHSLRVILQQHGVISSSLQDDGVQEELDVNSILSSDEYCKVLAGVLGEDIVFDLRGLLIERTGSNLRNRLAHGLLAPGQLFSTEVRYFWWLVLRLCFLGAVRSSSEPPSTSEGAATPAE